MQIDSKPYRTIWSHPDDCTITQIIDQRKLPHEFIIVDLSTVEDFCVAIKDMYVRGAGLIGATAGFAMYAAALQSRDTHFSEDIQKFSQTLSETRPTAKNLVWAIERQLDALATCTTLQEKRNKAFDVATAIADEDAHFCKQIGEHGVSLIKEISRRKNGAPVNILTHCNAGWLAFVDYGSATAPIYQANNDGIAVHVWVDETRPWLQGARLTAWELKEEGIPHTLIADNTGGHLMQHNMVDIVIVGTDRTTYTGDVANNIGTYLKALAAHDNNIPFYVALPSSTFDWQIENGVTGIPIEKRDGDEINKVTGLTEAGNMETVLIPPQNTISANYSFDVTPARLVTGLITERGIVSAEKEAILKLYPEKNQQKTKS
jgi:methylthioribose-1-phosphate isomerase